MTTTKNRMRLDYKDLPELQAPLGGLVAGDRLTVTLELMVVSNDDGGLDGDIEEVEYDLPESDAEVTSGEAEPSADSPVMVVISKRNGKKSKKADPDAATEESE